MCLGYWLVYTFLSIFLWKALNRFMSAYKKKKKCIQGRSLDAKLQMGTVKNRDDVKPWNLCNGNPEICSTMAFSMWYTDSYRKTAWVPDMLLHTCMKMYFCPVHLSLCEYVAVCLRDLHFNLINQSSLRAQLFAWSEIMFFVGMQKPILVHCAIIYCNIN